MPQLFTSILRGIPLASSPPGIPQHLTPVDLANGYPGSGGAPQPQRPQLPSLRSIQATLRERVPTGQPGAGQFLPGAAPTPQPTQGPVVGPVLGHQVERILQAEELGQAAEAERLRRTTVEYVLRRADPTHGLPRGTAPGGLPPGAGPPVLRAPEVSPRPTVGEFLEKGIVKAAIGLEAAKQSTEGIKGLVKPSPQPSKDDLLNATRVTVGPTVFFGTLPTVGSAAAGVTVAIPLTLGYVVYALRRESETLKGLPAEASLSARDPINLSPEDLLDLKRKNALRVQLDEQIAKERANSLASSDHVSGPIQDC